MALTDKVKLFIIDFDGTALGGCEPYARFPNNLSNFLDEISAQGVLWATCTTWHPYIQDEVFKRSILKSRPIRAIGRTALNCGLYMNSQLYMDAEWDQEMLAKKAEYWAKYLPAVRNFLGSCGEIISLTEYFDYIFSIEYTDRKTITRKLNFNKIIKEKTYLLFLPDRKTLQVFPYYMSKGLAVKKIQKQLKISPRFTMIAGDAVNDLPMLQKDIAVMQIVPANADTPTKKRIKQNGGVIGTLPYSDGIVEAARKILNMMKRG